MNQCPSCFSFNTPQAAFCDQCGRPLPGADSSRRKGASGAGRRRRDPFLIVVAGLVLLAGAILYLSTRGRGPGPDHPPAPAPEVAREASPGPDEPAQAPAEPEIIPVEMVQGLIDPALVTVDLLDERGERLRQVRGVLIESDRTILCRFRPLLGGYRGISRVAGGLDPGREVMGLVAYDPYRNLALIDRGLPKGGAEDQPTGRPLRARSDEAQVTPGMEVVAASLDRAVYTRVAEYPFYAPDGSSHARLADDPAIPADAFLALDSSGAAIGLCGPAREQEGGRKRLLLDPLVTVGQGIGQPAAFTLAEATRRFYEGTSADFLERARRAMQSRELGSAVELIEQALDQADREGYQPLELEPALALLRAALDGEIERRRRENDLRGTMLLLGTAVERFPAERRYWIDLAGARLEAGEQADSIGALLEARRLEPGSDIDVLLQRAYLEGSAREVTLGKLPVASEWLEKGLQALPGSARLHLELARTYERRGFLDEASQVYLQARQLDPGLAPEVDAALQRMEDQVRQREAVVIAIPPGSSTIQAEVVVNGTASYPFIIDTGATFTSIPQRMAEALGYQVGPGTERVVVATANGVIDAPLVVLDSVNLQGYTVRKVKAVVLPNRALADIGLLGLNFLDHFRYSVDPGRKQFRLERR